jgi:UDP-hydrolysing UDP-N-acetyl-D-glucosamine 2-epimerase
LRRIAVVTVARSDYGSCLPLLRAIDADPELELLLVVAGAHLAPEHGSTIAAIRADGFAPAAEVDMQLGSDSPLAVAKSIGVGVLGFAPALAELTPDCVLIVGDRVELLAVAAAALPLRIPLAHVSGGEITEGAIDEQVRHALSKLAHLHFVSSEEHAARLRQMGEEPWRITVTGDPALDLVATTEQLSREELGRRLGLALERPLLLVTYHPTTLSPLSAGEEVGRLLAALAEVDATLVFTAPNADAGSREIRAALEGFVASRPHRRTLVVSLGQPAYYSLLAVADAMVGNSSSGIWEAPSFGLPAVNVGDRQRGRLRAANVIDVACEAAAIGDGIRRALDPAFRASLVGLVNPYGDSCATERITAALRATEPGTTLLRKRFVDLPGAAA